MVFFIAFYFVVTPAIADKPEWAGKGKPSLEQKKAHKSAMKAKKGIGKDLDETKDSIGDDLDETKKSVEDDIEEAKGKN